MEYYPARRTRGKRLQLFLLLLLLAAGAARAALSVRSTVQGAVVYRGRIVLTQLLQESVLACLPQDAAYEGFVTLRTDQQGRVTAAEINAVALSRLQAAMVREINERLLSREPSYIALPLGTFTGSYYLAGRGPSVRFRVVSASGVAAELRHRFESAGVNQTRHCILLEMTVDGLALLPGMRSPFTVTTQAVLAETVIVGVTPQVYADLAAGGAVQK